MTHTLDAGRPGPTGRRGVHPAVLPLVVGIVVGLVLAGFVALVNGGNRWTTMEKHTQPASVRYPDKATHHLGLIEARSLVFGRHRTYELFVGLDPTLKYGHAMEVGFTSTRPEIQNVRWEPAGVRIVFRSGHETFIPARSFMYGR